jgi:hypothetical protein
MHIVNRGISITPRTMCIVRKSIQFSRREITGNPSPMRMGLMGWQGIKRRRMDKEKTEIWAVECEVSGKWVELTRKPTEEEANEVAGFMRLARVETRVKSLNEKKPELSKDPEVFQI